MSEENGTVVDDSQVVADAVNESAGENDATQDVPTWNYAEGVPGSGEVPEWFKADKYNSIEAQAKAYKDLEGKFGAFTGAPEEYTISLGEELQERGIEITPDDPLYEKAIEFAKNSNMSQDGFNNMINLYAMAKVAEGEALEQSKVDEMKALGDQSQTRVDNLVKWGRANLSEDLYQGFEDMATSAAAVQTLERLVAMTRSAPISPDAMQPQGGVSAEEVRKMQFELDDHGNRRIQTDPEFKARYQKLRDQVWGSDEHRVIVG